MSSEQSNEPEIADSSERKGFPWEKAMLVAVAIVGIACLFWYSTSVKKLNQFKFDNRQLWDLNVGKEAVDDNNYHTGEANLKKEVAELSGASHADWQKLADSEQQLAQFEFDSNQYRKAAKCFADQLATLAKLGKENSPEAASNRAYEAYSSLLSGDSGNATTQSMHAIDALKNSPNVNDHALMLAYVTLAECKVKVGNLEAAEKVYQTLINAEPTDREHIDILRAKAQARLADLARFRRELPLAHSEYKKAIGLFARTPDGKPYVPRCFYAMGLSAEEESDYPLALKNFEEAMALQGDARTKFALALKRDYASLLWRVNPLRAMFESLNALNSVDTE